MNAQPKILALNDLEYISYLNSQGELPKSLQGKIGTYAIFNSDQTLKYIGYSRDIYLSLKQHLVRQPQNCYGLKVQVIDRLSRTILAEIQQAWITENGSVPEGNGDEFKAWTEAIDVKPLMTTEEISAYDQTDEIGQEKILRDVSRRVEATILDLLKQRGVNEDIRFNPKLKTSGLLDLK
ncbi:MAG: GIY-YIG nuclease family protein [Microcoleaceae cyanobacterium]